MKSISITLLAIAITSTVFAEPVFEPPTDFADLEAVDPLDLKKVDFGVGLRHGEGMALASIGKNLDDVVGVATSAFLYLRPFDQASQTFGEFHVYKEPAGISSRGPNEFRDQNLSNSLFSARATDFYKELNSAEKDAKASFEKRNIVLDLYRHKGDWYIRWDGNLEGEGNATGKGPYGMYRKDMVEDILDEIETVAGNQKPEYFIIGDGMERLLGPDGLAPAEYSNFLAFYKEAVARIRKANASTKVGCGINYDRYLANVVPDFFSKQETTNELFRDAFESVILPCAEMGDIVALGSYRSNKDDTLSFPTGDVKVSEAYQFLRRLDTLYAESKPIVWYSVGSPLSGPVNYLSQKNYLQNFLGWIGGTHTDTVSWRYAMNFEGADTGDQKPAGRCKSFTESSRDFQQPVSDCYDGLFTSVFSKKDVFKWIEEKRK